jgi:hypothetical protein
MNTTEQPKFRHIKFILLFLICILGYTLLQQLNNPVMLPVNDDSDSKSIVNNALSLQDNQEEIPEISDYDDMINRPLFFEDRKPYVYIEPEKASPKTKKRKQAAPKKTELYSLSAVMMSTDKKLAIIQSGREKTMQRLSLGESIDGWIVENIEPRSVLLKKGNETKQLELEIKTSQRKQKSTTKTNRKTVQKENTQKTKKIAEEPKSKATIPET